jgi:hypothetical protein
MFSFLRMSIITDKKKLFFLVILFAVGDLFLFPSLYYSLHLFRKRSRHLLNQHAMDHLSHLQWKTRLRNWISNPSYLKSAQDPAQTKCSQQVHSHKHLPKELTLAACFLRQAILTHNSHLVFIVLPVLYINFPYMYKQK